MIQILENIKIQENLPNKDIKLKQNIISDLVVEKINKLILNKNIEEIEQKLELLKIIWLKNYKSAKTIDEKEKIFETIFFSIENLLNKLDYNKVYNTDSAIKKEWNNYKELNDIFTMVDIWINTNIEWANCNSWVLYIYLLLKNITNNDKSIKYSFVIRESDNHWLLYITLNAKLFLYHLDKNHIFKEKSKKISDSNYTHQKTLKQYCDYKDIDHIYWVEKHSFHYRKWNKIFKLYKKNWQIYAEINIWQKLKYINIFWLKKLTKKIYKIIKFRKKINLNNKWKTYDNLIKVLNEKFNWIDEINFAKQALKNISRLKLNNIIN